LLAREPIAPTIKGVRLERFHQRQVVELRIVGQRDHGAAAVELHRQHEVVRHLVHHHARQAPAAAVFLARVAHRHLVFQPIGDLRQELRQLAGADDQHAQARAVDR
jgi:hypothetical protein